MSACIGTALLSVLLMAAPAGAETGNLIGAPASSPAAEIAAPVEQVGAAPEPAPVEEAGTVATPSVASDVDAPTEPAEVVSEVEDVASAPPSSAAPQAKDIVSSIPPPAEATRAASAAVPVDLPSEAGPAAVDPNAIVGRLDEAAKNVGETSEHLLPAPHVDALVNGARQHSAETIAAATERLTASRGELPPPVTIAHPGMPAQAEELQPSVAAPVVTETTNDRPAGGFPNFPRHSGLLPNSTAIEAPSGHGDYLGNAAAIDIAKTPEPPPAHWGIGLSPRTEIVEAAISGPGHGRLGSPASPDLPPPAPQSPASAVGDGGGPSSAPVVALLALLALAAPAARRRLGEVAAFRPPTPFVCALERPG